MFLALLLSLSAPALAAAPAAAPVPAAAGAPTTAASVAIEVAGTYRPDRVIVPAGAPARLVFTRTTWDGCTREVVFPTLGIRAELPTDQPTAVDLPALAPGEYPFHCAMHMIHGVLEVR